MTQGYMATLVGTTLLISRSGLYYSKNAQGSRADRPTSGGYSGRKVFR